MKAVDNQLVVKNEEPGIADKAKSSVKSTFIYSSNVSGSEIEVDTKNGIVTLTSAGSGVRVHRIVRTVR